SRLYAGAPGAPGDSKAPVYDVGWQEGIHTVGRRSALSNLANIKASTLSDFNRAEAIALVCLGWDKNTAWPLFCASSTIHHHEPIASTAILLPSGSFFKTCFTVTEWPPSRFRIRLLITPGRTEAIPFIRSATC